MRVDWNKMIMRAEGTVLVALSVTIVGGRYVFSILPARALPLEIEEIDARDIRRESHSPKSLPNPSIEIIWHFQENPFGSLTARYKLPPVCNEIEALFLENHPARWITAGTEEGAM